MCPANVWLITSLLSLGYKCSVPQCGQVFRDLNSLDKHKKVSHPVAIRPKKVSCLIEMIQLIKASYIKVHFRFGATLAVKFSLRTTTWPSIQRVMVSLQREKFQSYRPSRPLSAKSVPSKAFQPDSNFRHFRRHQDR